ncbi:hypothetical protein C8R47DRAFT_437077 [Mycena vitilis]|nr:hypothetical protein C8R47DRAFT_437077 [Mycena vitilis]
MPNPTNPTPHKRPFADITDRFVSPAPRLKRKPKTPGGALGEKLRLRVIETTKAFPSSLPPSSPPLYSSSSRGLPLLGSEDEVAQEVNEDVPLYGHEDFGTMLPSEDDECDSDAENRAPANLSDPFGFFAVERKLKAERALEPAVAHHGRVTDDKERDDGLVMPPTPHKPGPGKRRLSHVFSPESASLVSSPSPLKGRYSDANTSRNVLMAEVDEEEDTPPKRKKARQSSETSLPPRRSTRGQTKAVAEKKNAAPKPKTRARKAAPKPSAAKPRSKGKKKAVEEDDEDDDAQEKFEAERQARLEYFRKLEDYSFEKENVYVV